MTTKTMTFTNEEMYTITQVLANYQMTGRMGYAIARNQRKMLDCIQEYTSIRDDYIKSHGRILNESGLFSIEVSAMMHDIGDIANTTSNIDVCLITEDDLINSNITSDQMTNLIWMVDDGTSTVAAEVVH